MSNAAASGLPPNLAMQGAARWRWEHSMTVLLLVAVAAVAGTRPSAVVDYGRAVTCAALWRHAAATEAHDAAAAMAILERLRAYRPVDARFQGALALRLVNLHVRAGDGRGAELISELGQRGLLQRGDPQLLAGIGHMHLQLGRPDLAAAFLESALRRHAGGDAIDIDIRAALSLAYQDLERFDEAEQILLGLADQYPEVPQVHNDLGYFYAERGERLDEAERLTKRAVSMERRAVWRRLGPGAEVGRVRLGGFVDSLGWVRYRQNRLAEAEKLLLEAERLTASSPSYEILYHLAQLYFDRGQDIRAAGYLKKALAERPDYEPALRLLNRLEGSRRENQIIGLPTAPGLPVAAREIDPGHAQRRQA